MNIFLLDNSPSLLAKAHDDNRCAKMCLETAQMLTDTIRGLGTCDHPRWLYKPCNPTHRIVRFLVSHSPCNAGPLLSEVFTIGLELGQEYSRRFGKQHKSHTYLLQLFNHCSNYYNLILTDSLPILTQHQPPCLSNIRASENRSKLFAYANYPVYRSDISPAQLVNLYRLYFVTKRNIRYEHTQPPEWFAQTLAQAKSLGLTIGA